MSEPIGEILRKERELRQISLEEISQTTRIPLRVLRNLEDDRHQELPGEVFVRGYIRSYGRALEMPEDTIEGLVEALSAEKDKDLSPAPMASVSSPERGRRFGIAIALVVLLILFTLALSIVLRPRRRGTEEIELSRAPAPLILPGQPPRPAIT